MKRIDEYIDQLVEKKVPYLDLAVLRDGEEIYRYYKGRNGATGREKLLMYSATKPITATLTLRMIEDGAFTLDTPVGDILPEFKEAYLLNEKEERVAPQTVMTVKHLLTMTAGLNYNYMRYPIEEALSNAHGMSDTRAAVSAFAKAPLLFEPGSRFQYSFCHDALAAVIEEASGMPFSAYMKKILLDPLGMTETYFSRMKDNDVSDIYIADENGNLSLSDKNNAFQFTDGYESGGAGLISTVNDYARFARALSLGGEGVLKPESVKLLSSPVLGSIHVDNGFTCVQGSDYGYGLGVRVRRVPTEWGLPVGEFGWDGAAGSYLMIDPTRRVAVVLGMHLRNWPVVFRGEDIEILKRVYEGLSL